jgi:predicted cupin superfamily sugar epimerase
MVDAQDVIRLLDLKPHPEGGHYRETFRDAADAGTARGVSTAIYFLLCAGERSRWHRVDAAEVWHFYAGAPLALSIGREGRTSTVRLGIDLAAGERPQAVVPANAWQEAESLGAWTLVGRPLAPAFEFACFVRSPEVIRPLEAPHSHHRVSYTELFPLSADAAGGE